MQQISMQQKIPEMKQKSRNKKKNNETKIQK